MRVRVRMRMRMRARAPLKGQERMLEREPDAERYLLIGPQESSI